MTIFETKMCRISGVRIACRLLQILYLLFQLRQRGIYALLLIRIAAGQYTELLEHYRAVVESEEYKASPAYRLQEYLKQFQRESGYNDVFIPAMQRLSPAYREYHKSLQAANEVFLRHFQQE